MDENKEAPDYNASDPAQVNRARKKHARLNTEMDEVLRMIMSQPNGRRWIAEQIRFVDPMGNPVVLGDSHATYYNFGGQQYGKKLMSECQRVCPSSYIKMLAEAEKDK